MLLFVSLEWTEHTELLWYVRGTNGRIAGAHSAYQTINESQGDQDEIRDRQNRTKFPFKKVAYPRLGMRDQLPENKALNCYHICKVHPALSVRLKTATTEFFVLEISLNFKVFRDDELVGSDETA
ncbi:hypothetical protein Y032_0375g226 [Ancylostoma ceylanicum]|uniref:Uncharacterized protein n=1 Tax=Ancylostoma ceylanicum TaxID=53326 RepID=A0A016RTJ5_9BILA|nr:hypothetical protein Y032_0375g226 [Ancylostoma ceylanicum]